MRKGEMSRDMEEREEGNGKTEARRGRVRERKSLALTLAA